MEVGISWYYDLFCCTTRKTLIMDDKVRFGKTMLEKMKRKQYMPPTYFKYEDIPMTTSKTAIFFVKKAGSSAAKGVNAYYYRDMENIDYSGCVIQQDFSNPDLIYNNDKDETGYRYKIRAYVILKGGKIYLHKLTWASRANTKFKIDQHSSDAHLRQVCVVCQREGSTFFSPDEKIQNMEKVFDSIRESVVELKAVFDKEVVSIGNDEYTILGIDYVIDSDKNAQIIEINHRSNYEHSRETTDNVDIPVIKDVLALLANGVKENEGIDGLEEGLFSKNFT